MNTISLRVFATIAACVALMVFGGPRTLAVGPNLMMNSGFEEGTTDQWLPQYNSTTGYGWFVTSSTAHTGSYSLEGNLDQSWQNCYQTESTVWANTNYTTSLWVKGSGSFTYEVIPGDWSSAIASTTVTATSTWQQINLQYNTGSNTQVELLVDDTNGPGTVYLDDFSNALTAGSTLSFNTSDPGASGLSYVWGDEFNNSSTIDVNASGNDGYHWYPQMFFGWTTNPPSAYSVSNGSLQLTGCSNNWGQTLTTALPASNSLGYAGTTIGANGATALYIEARIAIPGALEGSAVGWWMTDMHGETGLNEGMKGNPGHNEDIEQDFLEYYEGYGRPWDYSSTSHDWVDGVTTSTAIGTWMCLNVDNDVDSFWGAYHTYGLLWVPGTAANGWIGYRQPYFDGTPGAATTWIGNQTYTGTFPPTLTTMGSYFNSLMDTDLFDLILGVGQTSSQADVDYVHVFSTTINSLQVVTTGGTVGNPPTGPTGLSANAGSSSITLNWTASSGATTYNIYRGTSSGGEGASPIGSSSTASYTDSTATNGTTYYYFVEGVNTFASSVPSNEASATLTTLPTITNLSETTGLAYDVVTITGTNLTGATAVKFGTYAATFTVVSATSITATVPPAPPSAPVYVTVTTPSGTATSSQTFTYQQPVVTSFTPTYGPVGTSVTITGTGFIGLTSIKFNGTAVATWTRTGTTQLVTTVPTGATTGPISVITGGGTGTSSTSFTVGKPAPTISNLSETSGLAYDVVTITGNFFTGATSVKFGAYAATFTVVSATSITASVPPVPPSSPVNVTVTTPNGTATSSQTFTYQAPAVTSFTPTSGPVGTSVTITGTGFIGLTAIKFNGTAVATWTRTGTTQLVTTVPTGATTGAVSVTTGGGTGTSTTSFTVVLPPAPTITNLSETTGLAYDVVTITGTNFTGATSVKFGTYAATFTVVSATSITATVPPVPPSASVNVTVTTPGGTATSSQTFTYQQPVVTSFTPTYGPVGTSVTITGTGFIGLTSITFNGKAVATWTRTGTTQLVTTVPTGATTGPIAVTTGGGTGTSTTNYTVGTPAPTITNLSETTGLAYDVVTITGNFFTGATSVKFGAYAATFTVVSATSITASVPPVPPSSPVNVTVTTPGGTGTSSQTFTYQTPTVTSFTPTSGATGTSVTITGTGFIGLTSIKFNGTAVATWTRTGTTQLVTTVPTGATTGPISVTTGGGTGTSSSSFTVP